MSVRRVVTGHDDSGKAVVVSDEVVEPTDPEFAPKWSIWAADAPVALPDAGGAPGFAGPLVPRPGGVHVVVLTFPVGFNPDVMFDTTDPVAAAGLAREQMATAFAMVPDPNPAGSYGALPGFTGMHATASVDCMLQLSGEAVLVLEDTEVRLAPGDWAVVNGVTHSWRNDGDEPAVLVGVVAGAHHDGVPVRKVEA